MSPPPVFSDDQHRAIDAIQLWLRQGNGQTFTFGGLAGTDKTTISAGLSDLLPDYAITYAAPTGKAAQVLSAKLGRPAVTIHQLIYHPETVHCAECSYPTGGHCHATARTLCGCELLWRDKRGAGALGKQLFVIDEASMVARRLYTDLLEYVSYRPILFVGDHGQLPPITRPVGLPAFNLMANPDFRLETIHRQLADSPILKLAMQARQTGIISVGDCGRGVRKIGRDSKTALADFDPDDSLILTYTNATRLAHNQLVRRRML